ncbi:MAG: hypothetical protein ACRC8J_10275, partial [Phocaeicola sp.]
MKKNDFLSPYQHKGFSPYLLRLLSLVDNLTVLSAVLFVSAFIYEHGYPLTHSIGVAIHIIYRLAWILFLLNTLLHGLFKGIYPPATTGKFTLPLNILLYLTLVPVIFHEPDKAGLIHGFWK